MHARRIASAPNVLSTIAAARGTASDRAMWSGIVVASITGSSLSTARTSWRISGSTDAGSPAVLAISVARPKPACANGRYKKGLGDSPGASMVTSPTTPTTVIQASPPS
jgi:hypothetical protein